MLNRNFRYKDSSAAMNMQKPECSGAGDDGNKNMNGEIRQLLCKLRKIDFALADTVLYLDAYPKCKAAMARYKELSSERHELTQKLAQKGYPMNFACNLSADWRWTDAPWPWEYEANI